MPELQIIDVLKAADFPIATEFKGSFDLKIGGGKTVPMPVRALSLKELRALQEESPIPEKENAEGTAIMTARVAQWVRGVDYATSEIGGINGDTLAAKIQWAQANSDPVAFFDIYQYVLDRMSGLAGGVSFVEVPEATPKNVAEIFKARAQSNIFDFGIGDKILRFHVATVPGAQIKAIDIECDAGLPPTKTIKASIREGAGGKKFQDPNDPDYKLRVRNKDNERSVKQLELALGFELPGSTYIERFDWLAERPAYVVLNLFSKIQSTTIQYRERADFTQGS